MNAVAEAARKYDGWTDEMSSSWTPTMFTSPFGESIPLHDSQLWTTPGNNSDEYYKPSPRVAREELEHSVDSSDNFDAGYTISNTTTGPGTFVHAKHPENIHQTPNEDAPFDEGAVSTTIASPPHCHYSSHSSEVANKYSPQSISGVSPVTGSSVHWMADGAVDHPSPPSPSPSINAAIDPSPTPKHRHNRERNRKAAHKCRQKAKQSMSDLQARERALSQQNRMLQEHAGSLRDEILDLKNEILKHSNCDSDIIQNYIARAARDVR